MPLIRRLCQFATPILAAAGEEDDYFVMPSRAKQATFFQCAERRRRYRADFAELGHLKRAAGIIVRYLMRLPFIAILGTPLRFHEIVCRRVA